MRFVRVRNIFQFLASVFLLLALISIFAPASESTAALTNAKITLPEEKIPLYASNSINIWNFCDRGDDDPSGECVTPTGDKITWIGDSYSVGAKDKIMEALPGVDLGDENPGNTINPYHYIQGSKHLGMDAGEGSGGSSGLTILKEIHDDGKLRPYLVLALSTNDPVGESAMNGYLQKIIDDGLIDDSTKVILTTAYTTRSDLDYSGGNAAMKAFASTHDNFYVADWAAVAKPEYYNTDPIHPTGEGGYDAWVDTIVKTLPVDCNSGLLSGDNIAEKVWNWLYTYFNEKNISNINISAVISGIMGNFTVESGINPYMVGYTGDGYGIHMNLGANGGAELRQKVNDAVGTDYFKQYGYPNYWTDETDADRFLSDASVPQDAIDKAIDIELSMITDGNYTTGAYWDSEFMVGLKEWGVADTPQGYSDLFLVTMERAVGGGSPIEDAGVSAHYNGHYQGASDRRDRAQYIYDKYASKAGSNNSAGKSKKVSSSSDRYDAASGSETASSKITWDSDGWITGGMSGYNKEDAGSLGTSYNGGKPNKILLHYTQGTSNGLAAYGSNTNYAAHFTIDLLKKEVYQHHPLNRPSGAVIDSDDVRDIVQIEIVGYGFSDDNPDNPSRDSQCTIGGTDYTSSDYCFAKFTNEDWDYLATLLIGISNWGKENGTNIPLSSSVTWTGEISELRMDESSFDAATGIVAHMHAPDPRNHSDTGNIWPLVQSAIARQACDMDGNKDNISGAKNADKQATEVGRMWFDNYDTDSMKTLLENYGDLAYRTGQAYDIPWIAILVQGRYEDGILEPNTMCGSNNFWGIACYDGLGAGEGRNYSSLGEGFTGYGETVHNGHYDNAIGEEDPARYLQLLDEDGWNSGTYEGYKGSIDALQAYIDTPEGQSVIAEFGAANCDSGDNDICNDKKKDTSSGDVAALQALVKEWAWPTSGPGSSSAQSAYTEAMEHASYVGGCGGQDCGAFVSNLIIESGWDTDFKSAPTWDQIDYMDGSDKWTNVTSQINSNSDAQPGDVIICDISKGDSCVGTTGHVLIYVGDIDGFSSKMASASLCGRWPEADAADDISYYVDNGYRIYRKTG